MTLRILLSTGLLATALAVTHSTFAESPPGVVRTAASTERNWSDATGKYHVTASLVKADAKDAWLRKALGEVRRVPIERLSLTDQQFVERQQSSTAPKLANAARGAWRAIQQAGRNRFIGGHHRTWLDNTGQHNEQASLVGINESKALLRKLGGRIVEVPLARLSERDLAYIRDRGKAWLPLNVWRPVAAQVVPQVDGILNGEPPSVDLLPTPDAVHIRLGRAYLNRRFAREIDKSVQVRDQILGTTIRGTALVDGNVQVQPVAAVGQGALLVVVNGSAESETVGTHHPVWIHSRGTTDFHGTKQIFLTSDGVKFHPAQVTASTRSRTTGISTSLPHLRGRIALRIATRRVDESRPTADRISAAHNRKRVARDIDRQVEQLLRSTDTILTRHQDRVREAFGLQDTKMVCSSTDDYLEFAFLGQDVKEDAPSPPDFMSQSDLEIVLHTPSRTPAALGPVARVMLTNLFNVLLDDLLERRAEKRGKEAVSCRLVWSRDQQWLAIMADGDGGAPPVVARRP